MEEKKLIEKLEEVSCPEIEISSYKRRLKAILMEKYFREKRRWEIFDILKRVIPAGAIAILLIGIIFTNLIFPRYSASEAKEIALQNPQIKEWMDQGAIIEDIEIIKNRAYILIQPVKEMEKIFVKEAAPTIEEIKKEEFNGGLAEVNLKEKKIVKIEKLTPLVIPLTEEEKEKAKEIAKNNPEIQKVIPEEAEILNIESLPSQLKLIKRGNSVQILPEPETEKKASIIYQFGKNRWGGKINLNEEKVEEVNFLGETENDTTLQK